MFVSGSEVLVYDDALDERGSVDDGTSRLALDDVVPALRQDMAQTFGSGLRSLVRLRGSPLESPIQLRWFTLCERLLAHFRLSTPRP